MKKCPICNKAIDNKELVCRECGYDESLDYEKYPSFQLLKGHELTNSKRKKNYADLLKIKQEEEEKKILESPKYKDLEKKLKKSKADNSKQKKLLEEKLNIIAELQEKLEEAAEYKKNTDTLYKSYEIMREENTELKNKYSELNRIVNEEYHKNAGLEETIKQIKEENNTYKIKISKLKNEIETLNKTNNKINNIEQTGTNNNIQNSAVKVETVNNVTVSPKECTIDTDHDNYRVKEGERLTIRIKYTKNDLATGLSQSIVDKTIIKYEGDQKLGHQNNLGTYTALKEGQTEIEFYLYDKNKDKLCSKKVSVTVIKDDTGIRDELYKGKIQYAIRYIACEQSNMKVYVNIRKMKREEWNKKLINAEDTYIEKVNKAIANYATGVDSKDVIGIADHTKLMSRSTKGILMTENSFYSSYWKGKLLYREIKEISRDDKNVYIKKANNQMITISESKYIDDIYDFFSELDVQADGLWKVVSN